MPESIIVKLFLFSRAQHLYRQNSFQYVGNLAITFLHKNRVHFFKIQTGLIKVEIDKKTIIFLNVHPFSFFIIF